ncbi:MAG TPA: UDP-3-O-(3-hydroxymyristoyl)glucosamine N-acyltransferase [Acidisarcina sp.]|nr:UDP-3-O-(3-hydroxymyristoyl)glucosamine N-acyltransferase [Acidisarcina sp.]
MKSLSELAALLDLELQNGAGNPEIRSVSSSKTAGPNALVFAEDEESLQTAFSSGAAAVLTTAALAAQVPGGKPLLVGKHPRLHFAQAAALLREGRRWTGIHASAVVASSARLGAEVSVEAGAVIGEDASIGRRSSIGAGAVIGQGVVIGDDCRIYPRAVLYPGTTLGNRVVVHAGAVLGADGFGYVRDPVTGEYLQFPQQGTLVLEDGVEIGANTTIDRGALEETRIGHGTKIDNLVHIGHNCRIGSDVVIASLTGISGSCSVGDGAMLGGQVGMGDHSSVGDGVILGGQAGVLPHKHLVGPGVLFWGTPAKPVKQYLRELATLGRLTRKGRE